MRRFLSGHEVRTFDETGWHIQLENGELLKAAEASGFEVMITSDQNIGYQQNLKGRKLALVVLGSNIWPIVSSHGAEIAARADTASRGSFDFIEMPLPPKPRRNS
ncbi:MAG: hypothetical protein ABI824_06405 [Acidobacteriota bacterium]